MYLMVVRKSFRKRIDLVFFAEFRFCGLKTSVGYV